MIYKSSPEGLVRKCTFRFVLLFLLIMLFVRKGLALSNSEPLRDAHNAFRGTSSFVDTSSTVSVLPKKSCGFSSFPLTVH